MIRPRNSCSNCGFNHPTQPCPATNAVCMLCNNRGHYARNCQLDKKKLKPNVPTAMVEDTAAAAVRPARNMCGFCGSPPHSRAICPASGIVCTTCRRIGHFPQMCKTPTDAPPSRYLTKFLCKYGL